MNPQYPLIIEKKPKKLLWVAISLVTVILLTIAVAAYVFLIYIPSTPENRYRTGFGAVGTGMQYLIEDDDLRKQFRSTAYEVELTVEDKNTSEEFNKLEITTSGEYDDQAGSSLLSLYVDEEKMGDLEIRILNPENTLPKMYYKLSNLADYDDELESSVSQYTDKTIDEIAETWWVLDFQEMLDSGIITDEISTSFEELKEELDLEEILSQEDYEEVIEIIVSLMQEYIFTSDSEKMILEMDEFIGEEEFEGQMAHKYKVTINEDNLNAFMVDLIDRLSETENAQQIEEAIEDFTWEELKTDLKKAIEDQKESEDSASLELQTLTAWIDSETRVLRNLRMESLDPNDAASYGMTLDYSILMDDSRIELGSKISLYNDDSCIWHIFSPGEQGQFETEDRQNDACPYNYESLTVFESRLKECYGEDLANPTGDLKREGACSTLRQIVGIKDGAQPDILSGKTIVDTTEKTFKFEFSFEDINYKVSLTLDLVSQEEVADVEEPSNPESLIKAIEDMLVQSDEPVVDDQLTRSLRDLTRINEVNAIQAQLLQAQANNNGVLPSNAAELRTALENLSLDFYTGEAGGLVSTNDREINDIATEFKIQIAQRGDVTTSHNTPSADEVHIILGASCIPATTLAPSTAYTNAAANITEEASPRVFALLYALESRSNVLCVDNS